MKHKKLDERYLSSRKALSEKYGPRELWSVIDHWPLYVGLGNLSRFMAISELLKSTLKVPGDVAEFGSWRGANLMFLTKLIKISDGWGSKVVHCFDSFEGLTEFSGKDDLNPETKGKYKGSLQELKDLIEISELDDDIEIHKGLIEETLVPLLKKRPELSFSFVYIDTDLYTSTQLILNELHTRLMKGGVFVFDEWNYADWPGEGVAASEFMQKFGDFYQVENVPMARQPSLVLRKIKS